MTRRLLVLEQWNQFVRECLHPNAPAVQKQEMRRAFYGGASMILFRLLGELAPGDEITPSDLEAMMAIQEELREFVEQVKAGRA
jgi:hypothetical protein